MKKLLGLLVAFVVVLAGCGSGGGAAEGDDVLTIWSFFEGPPKEALDYYAEQTGNEVDFVTISYEDFQTKLNTVVGTDDAPDMIALERGFMGNYIQSDNFLNLSDVEGIDQDKLATIEEDSSAGIAGPGYVNDEMKGISWGVTSSAFFYRSDLASQCLDINSVEEMEAATQTVEDYATLYETLQSSSDETCSSMSLLSYPDYQAGLLQQIGMYKVDTDNSTYTIPSQFADVLDIIKTNNDDGLVFSPQGDKTQIITANQNDQALGYIQAAWGTQVAEEYDQSGQWAIAATPLQYTAGGTFLTVTNNADQDMVSEFLNMTFLDEDWYMDNMDSFGMIPNEKVMNEYFENHDGSNEYYSGQNVSQKLVEIAGQTEDYDPVTPYDSGIGTSITEVITAYAIDGTVSTTDEAIQMLSDKISTLYPDLTVEVE